MKNFVVVAVVIVAGLGATLFLMNNGSTPNDTTSNLSENSADQDMNSPETESAPAVTADPVATVNGEEISNADFTAQQTQTLTAQGMDPTTVDSETQTAINNQVLDSLISQELLRQAAIEAGIEVSEADVDAQLEQIKGQFEDETGYEQALAQQGVTEEEIRSQLTAELRVEPYLQQELDLNSITVTEEELNQTYEELSAQQELPPMEEVRGQVEQLAMQQKQQPLINDHIAELREEAEVEILI